MKKLILIILLIMLAGCSNTAATSDPEPDVIEDEAVEPVLVFDEPIDVSENNEEYRYNLSEIRVRSDASKSGEVVGHVYEGDHYKVLETKSNEDLTWYRIGDDQWIADDGTWTSRYYFVHFKSNNGSKRELVQGYGFGMDDMMMDWITLDHNRFSTDGYVFVGWNTLPDGSGSYYRESEWTREVCKEDSNIYLYAQWVPVKEENIKIKAVSDLNVIDGPSFGNNRIYGVIREGDCFSILESVEYNGKIWDRIATDSWICDQRNGMEILDEFTEDFSNINMAKD